jgi:anti-sigma factor RsiW
MEKRQRWQLLNAYVDHELPADTAAEVSRDAARDRTMARDIANLSELKAALGQVMEDDLAAMSLPDIPHGRRRPKTARRWALAAAAVMLIVAAGSVFSVLIAPGHAERLRQAAVEAHGLWDQRLAPREQPAGGALLAAAVTVGLRPALELFGLQMVAAREVKVGELSGLHLRYRGQRGCRVSVTIFPNAAAFSADPTRSQRGALTVYEGLAGNAAYLVLAEDMDEDRLALVVSAVQSTLTRGRLPSDTRTAMAEDPAARASCLS